MATILIIDNDKSAFSFLKERLSCEEFYVLTAASGEEGMKLINDNQIDLVIIGMTLSGEIGFNIITKMKKLCPDIKIIAIFDTSHGPIKLCLKAAKFSGAEYALSKPFEVSNLLTDVHELLKRKKTA